MLLADQVSDFISHQSTLTQVVAVLILLGLIFG